MPNPDDAVTVNVRAIFAVGDLAASPRAPDQSLIDKYLYIGRNSLVRLFEPEVVNTAVRFTIDQVLTFDYQGAVSGSVQIADPQLYNINLSVNTTVNYQSTLNPVPLNSQGQFFFTRTYPGIKQLEVRRIDNDQLVAVYETPILSRSYWIPREGTNPTDRRRMIDRCYTYDQAVAAIALMNLQDPMVDTYIKGCAECVGLDGSVKFWLNRFSLMTTESTTIRTGNAAWIYYALAYYLLKYPDGSQAASVRTKLLAGLDWLETMKVTDPMDRRYGLYRGGIGNSSDPNATVPWVATEHSIDIWFLFDMLDKAKFGADGFYRAKADQLAADMITKLWMEDQGRMRQGLDDLDDDNRATLDICSWGGIWLKNIDDLKAARSYQYMENFKYTTAECTGYAAYNGSLGQGYDGYPMGVWTEGTMGAVLLHRMQGNQDAALFYVQQAQILNIDPVGYRDSSDIVDPDTVYNPYAQDCNTAWVILALLPEVFWNVNQPKLGTA